MKKNKTVAFMLAATLLVGGTFMGTKALFTDNVTANNDLVITMGNLNLDIVEGKWENTNPGQETTQGEGEKSNEFSNAKPGDVFRKKITVKNEGSLKRKLSISKTGRHPILPQGMSFDDAELMELDGLVLRAGEVSHEYYITLTIDKSLGGVYEEEGYNKANQPTFEFNGIYEMKAEQTDENAAQPRLNR